MIAGCMASGAGGWYPGALCGRIRLYPFLHSPVNVFASTNVVNISRLSNSSLSFPLNDSMCPFSQGLPGSMNSVLTPRWVDGYATQLVRTALSTIHDSPTLEHAAISPVGLIPEEVSDVPAIGRSTVRPFLIDFAPEETLYGT